ncbi:histone deacetylase 14 [Artemisia annua]|uniref:Histone deacetylase 14 n=1 Tax=Artemisia annua TaxID=35608 RepID=A0A2U1MRR2_ARTAN|nr:histone deacetylase 14 [Artemisia annua]
MDVFTCTSVGTFARLAKQKPIRKVVYCAVPALSHDHDDPEQNTWDQECSDRVTYILSGLKKAKLTPKFRESEIIQLKNIRSATMEEIQSVHSRSYVLSLMQLTREAKDKGVLLFEDTELSCAPSYVTGKFDIEPPSSEAIIFRKTESQPSNP